MNDFIYESVDIKRCGCYVANSEMLQDRPFQRILVPLRSCNYQMEVVNAMVNVTLTQTYQNPTDKFLEVEYSFPISPSACVYRFVAEFGNTRIEGVVKEKEEAKREYQ
jgi:Ca-activated chloride channel family protein